MWKFRNYATTFRILYFPPLANQPRQSTTPGAVFGEARTYTYFKSALIRRIMLNDYSKNKGGKELLTIISKILFLIFKRLFNSYSMSFAFSVVMPSIAKGKRVREINALISAGSSMSKSGLAG
jgi:hypothetical protein